MPCFDHRNKYKLKHERKDSGEDGLDAGKALTMIYNTLSFSSSLIFDIVYVHDSTVKIRFLTWWNKFHCFAKVHRYFSCHWGSVTYFNADHGLSKTVPFKQIQFAPSWLFWVIFATRWVYLMWIFLSFLISLFLVIKVNARNRKVWSQLIQMQVGVAVIGISNYLLLFQNSLLPGLAQKRERPVQLATAYSERNNQIQEGGEGEGQILHPKNWAS